MRQKTLVYPYDRQFLPVLQFADKVEKYEFYSLVSPSGWGLSGKDAGAAGLATPVGIIVTDDFEAALSECETVLVAQSDLPLSKEEHLLPCMRLAIEQGKHIVCTVELTDEEIQMFSELAEINSVRFEIANKRTDHVRLAKHAVENTIALHDVHAPVIMIFGLIELVSKFATQLAFEDYLVSQGYSVSLITSREYGELLGAHSAPGFMFSKEFTEEEKIILFNNYVKQIELRESPDVILIGVPGGMLPTTNRITNRFGITAFEITQGITPDASIVCTLCAEYTAEYFDNLTPLLNAKFSIETTGYVVDNIATTFSGQEQDEDLPMLLLDEAALASRTFPHVGTPVVSRLEREKLFTDVIDQLASYADTMTL